MLKVSGRLFGVLLLCVATRAHAVQVMVDPGLVDSVADEIVMSVGDQLNGIQLMGQELEIDFIFTDMKHVKALVEGKVQYRPIVRVMHNGGPINIPGDLTNGPIGGFLSDENGNSLITNDSFTVGDGSAGTFIYGLIFDSEEDGGDLTDRLIHHDIHITVTLPELMLDTGGFAEFISGSTLSLTESPISDNDGNALGNLQFVVGEWEAMNAVPEPITAALGLMGLGMLGMATRRRVA